MKKYLLSTILLLLCTSYTWALTIHVQDGPTFEVGDTDTLIAETSLDNSGDDTEEAWVVDVLTANNIDADGIELTQKNEDDLFWYQTYDDNDQLLENTWAFYLADSPEYFLVKVGGNDKKVTTDFLFENVDNLNWAVVSLGDLGNIESISTVSHISEFVSEASPVPEPATMALLGSGLLGLAAFRRKNKVQ